MIVNVARIILALVFIFSGFVKGVDPWGTAIKLDEYFTAFSIEQLSPAKYIFSIALSGIEILIGFMLLFALKKRFTATITLIFISGFTLLTLHSAITNPVADCGCFGEAIKLGGWETFSKNVILLIISAIYLIYIRHTKLYKTGGSGTIAALVLISFSIGTYAQLSLPIIEFLPYKIGNKVTLSEDTGEYQTILTYKNIQSGEVRDFQVEDTTWYDETLWEFVDSRTKQLTKPKVNGAPLPLFNNEGAVDIIKEDEIILITSDTELFTKKELQRIKALKEFAEKNGRNIALATNMPLERINLDIAEYNIDPTQLKMLIRAHKGIVVIDKGTIIAKWKLSISPDFSQSNDTSMSGYIAKKREHIYVWGYISILTIILIIIFAIYRKSCTKQLY